LGKLSPSKAVTSAELSSDGQYLYLLDSGEPSVKAEKNVNGSLVVVSVSNRSELSVIDVGSAPRGLIHDRARDRILILSDVAPGKKRSEMSGDLRVFKGTEAIAVMPVAYSPALLTASPDGALFYVAGNDSVSAVDSSSLKVIGEIDFDSTGHKQSGRVLEDFAVTPDGKRGIAVFALGDKVAVLDLENRKPLASLTTGRRSVKFMKAMATGLENYNSQQYAQEQANETGVTQYYTVKTLTPASVAVAVSPDSKFAYAYNDQTYDVTIIDTQAPAVLSKLGISGGVGYQIETLPNGNAIALVGLLAITFIDTKTNQKISFGGEDHLKVGGLSGFLNAFEVSPSGTAACALVNHHIICLDTSTMKEVGRQEDFKNLSKMLFEEM